MYTCYQFWIGPAHKDESRALFYYANILCSAHFLYTYNGSFQSIGLLVYDWNIIYLPYSFIHHYLCTFYTVDIVIRAVRSELKHGVGKMDERGVQASRGMAYLPSCLSTNWQVWALREWVDGGREPELETALANGEILRTSEKVMIVLLSQGFLYARHCILYVLCNVARRRRGLMFRIVHQRASYFL